MDHKQLLINTAKENGVTDEAHIAYILATARLETDNFNKLEEYASGRDYEFRYDLGNTNDGDGVRYKGRGYVQVTGRANYQKIGDKLGYDLINNPDLLFNPVIAALATVIGMRDGLFTELKLLDFGLNPFFDSYNARKIVNGLSGADIVAGYFNEELYNLNNMSNYTNNDNGYLVVGVGEGFSHLAKRAGYENWASPLAWDTIASFNGWASYTGVVLQPGQRVRVIPNDQPIVLPSPEIKPERKPVVPTAIVSSEEPSIGDKLTTVSNHALPAGVIAILVTYLLKKVDPTIPDEVLTAFTAVTMWLINLLSVYLKNRA